MRTEHGAGAAAAGAGGGGKMPARDAGAGGGGGHALGGGGWQDVCGRKMNSRDLAVLTYAMSLLTHALRLRCASFFLFSFLRNFAYTRVLHTHTHSRTRKGSCPFSGHMPLSL